MTYQVYAIKTRPQSFSQVIGQIPVVSALTHALDKNKLHHAYLFTGTRGVGKTTIARIIAKALNCEQGVSSNPCNQCDNCLSITQGKFPDLVEIDAASKTKVEDTRSLLDTVIYSPIQGRYKIYLIDEVHMLSTHSFNALLKTLEEPPSHVKFLLATTDPHKIPATIVSRCLQFTLKWVDSMVIVNHLESILNQDNIKFESTALNLLAAAAQGSVRDSLSLLEQAVALGAGEVTAGGVRSMLGSLEGEDIITILKHIIAKDSEAVIKKVYDLTMLGADIGQVLTQLIYNLHQLAIIQQAPNIAADLDLELKSELMALAKEISSEDLQVYYQIALLAKRDLPYSPQPKLALEMALMRMLNFVPVDYTRVRDGASQKKAVISSNTVQSQINNQKIFERSQAQESVPLQQTVATTSIQKPLVEINKLELGSGNQNIPDKANWHIWVKQLNLTGIHLQIIKNTEFQNFSNDNLTLILDRRVKALVNQNRLDDISRRISQFIGKEVKLVLENSSINKDDRVKVITPTHIESEQHQQKHEELVAKLQNDPNIENIMRTFNGELKLDSVELIEDS